jgi:hypothetical protein
MKPAQARATATATPAPLTETRERVSESVSAARPARRISPNLHVRFASPAADATASGVRASPAACADLLAKMLKGQALDQAEQLTWQRGCDAQDGKRLARPPAEEPAR